MDNDRYRTFRLEDLENALRHTEITRDFLYPHTIICSRSALETLHQMIRRRIQNVNVSNPLEATTEVRNYRTRRYIRERNNNENMEEEEVRTNIIPENSGTALVDETTSRFSSAIWYDKIRSKTVVLAGVGGIGSYIGFLIARMKPVSLFIYDPDTVEAVNMSGQLYGLSDVGTPKVTALANMISNYANYHSVFSIRERYTENCEAADIMICGFDNMEARKVFFMKWLEHVMSLPEERKKKCLFIDGRLAAEEFQVLCITGDDGYNRKKYFRDYIFTDAEADATVCSYKQTTFMANMIGSVITNLFVNFVANECEPLIDRDLPFLTTYNAETMYFKTEA